MVNFFYIILVAFLTILLGGFIIDQGISLSRIFFPNEAATWEPIMFGLVYYGVDTGLIFIKNFIVKLIRKNKIQKETCSKCSSQNRCSSCSCQKRGDKK